MGWLPAGPGGAGRAAERVRGPRLLLAGADEVKGLTGWPGGASPGFDGFACWPWLATQIGHKAAFPGRQVPGSPEEYGEEVQQLPPREKPHGSFWKRGRQPVSGGSPARPSTACPGKR